MRNKLLLIATSLVFGMNVMLNAALPPQQSNFRNFGKELPGSYGAPAPISANANYYGAGSRSDFNAANMQQPFGQYDPRSTGYQQSALQPTSSSFGYQPSMQQPAYGQGQVMFDYTGSSY